MAEQPRQAERPPKPDSFAFRMANNGLDMHVQVYCFPKVRWSGSTKRRLLDPSRPLSIDTLAFVSCLLYGVTGDRERERPLSYRINPCPCLWHSHFPRAQ